MRLIKPSFEILRCPPGIEILQAIEECGRTCYKSEEKMTDDSALEFVRKIMKRKHVSVIEHEYIRVRFIIDRGVSHELVRHRLCAFSQESTRYCDYAGGHITFIVPPWINACGDEEFVTTYVGTRSEPNSIWKNSILTAEFDYKELRKFGWSPQQARSVLPNSLKTEIVVTANLREWRHIFNLRCAKAAHPQMQEIMIPLRDELRSRIPIIFDNNEE